MSDTEQDALVPIDEPSETVRKIDYQDIVEVSDKKVKRSRLKHGLYSIANVVLPDIESGEKFKEFAKSIKSHFSPENAFEDFLSDRIVIAMWKLFRADILEAAALMDGENPH